MQPAFYSEKKNKCSKAKRRSLLKLYRKGNIPKEYLSNYGISEKSFDFLLAYYRKNGLSLIDSFYNASYIYSVYRTDSSKRALKSEYENFISHPRGWFNENDAVLKNNKWSLANTALAFLPKVIRAGALVFSALSLKFKNALRNARAHADNIVGRSLSIFGFVKRNFALISFALLLCAFVSYSSHIISGPAYLNVYVDGEMIGSVQNASEVENVKLSLEKNISESLGKTYIMKNTVSYSVSHKPLQKSLNSNELYNILNEKTKQDIVLAYGLYIDKVLVAVNDNKVQMYDAMEELLEKFRQFRDQTSYEANVVRVDYANDIQILEGNFLKSDVTDINDIRKTLGLLPTSDVDFKNLYLFTYENLTKYEKQESELSETVEFYPALKAMPTLSVNETVAGEETPVSENDSLTHLNYKIIKTEVYEEVMQRQTEYINDASVFDGVEFTISQGSDGRQLSTYEVTYVDGQEVDRKLVSFEVIVPAVNKVIRRGIKIPTEDETDLVPTGTYILPYQGSYLSSSYGRRVLNGRVEIHTGWDIPGPSGAPIVAIDGGVVTEVSSNSGYGIYVVIDHGNDLQSIYAHMSQATVEVGDKVGQGYAIGKIGRTGRATGNHVHLEIRLNGVLQNPEKYLGKMNRR